jgi:1-acyl-sn-glycerol-3-phosphate acyltransferase
MNAQLPRISAGVMRVFTAYTRRSARKNFHSLRILRCGLPSPDPSRPLVIYLNHASWWDPLVSLLLAREFFPQRASFAPIDAAMLERYGIFKHLGFFGVEPGTTRGARTFLRTAHTILASSRRALWLTPQGRFSDPRERPLRLQEGLGAIAAREPHATFLPLAIEYPFWTEPRPEILVSFGAPVTPVAEVPRKPAEWMRLFSEALARTQDELAARSLRRELDDWVVLGRGKSGVNFLYDAWLRLRARARRQPFQPEHPTEAKR